MTNKHCMLALSSLIMIIVWILSFFQPFLVVCQRLKSAKTKMNLVRIQHFAQGQQFPKKYYNFLLQTKLVKTDVLLTILLS